MSETTTPEIPTFTVRRGSVRCRVLLAVSTDPDTPTSVADVQEKLPGVAVDHIGVELSTLTAKGALRRVGRGRYVRLVGEQLEFRG